LFGIFEAILKMNGATMVRAGNFYQIVPAGTSARLPIEVQSTQSGVAPDDQIILQLVPMKFVAADEMARLLTPYISEGGLPIVAQGSVLLITDRRSNLRKLLEIIDEFDTRAFLGERVRMLPINNNRVKDVVDDLKTVFSGYALSSNTAIRFLPIERMNAVLVVSPNPNVFPEVERWLDRLDQPIQSAGLGTFVYKVRNSRAVDLYRVLTELYRIDPTGAPTGSASRRSSATCAQHSTSAAAASARDGKRGGTGTQRNTGTGQTFGFDSYCRGHRQQCAGRSGHAARLQDDRTHTAGTRHFAAPGLDRRSDL
jgi:general secretion pathway protein D